MQKKNLVVTLVATGMIAATSAIPAAALQPADTATDVAPNIIDGTRATSNPGAAVLLRGNHAACSASVIGAQYILTATHCVPQGAAPSGFQVRVNSLNKDSGGQVYQIESWKTQYDIRVAKLTTPISNPTIAPLATQDPPIGSVNQIYGWGATAAGNGQPMSSFLKTANVKIDKMETDLHKGPALHSIGENGNAWKGDSGGPQFYNGKQVGVASSAWTPTKAQIYGSVAQNLDFIKGAMSDGGTDPAPNPGQPNPGQPNPPRPAPERPEIPRPNPGQPNIPRPGFPRPNPGQPNIPRPNPGQPNLPWPGWPNRPGNPGNTNPWPHLPNHPGLPGRTWPYAGSGGAVFF